MMAAWRWRAGRPPDNRGEDPGRGCLQTKRRWRAEQTAAATAINGGARQGCLPGAERGPAGGGDGRRRPRRQGAEMGGQGPRGGCGPPTGAPGGGGGGTA